jgi:hypothetical protein
MMKLRSSRLTVAVLAAATVILAAGGAAIGSNMGFKFNKPLTRVGDAPGVQTGKNWTSVPYNNPYGTFNGLCSQTGLVSTGLTRTGFTVDNYDATHPGFSSATCGSTTPASFNGTFPLKPGLGIEIRQPSNAAAFVTSIIIVGSHNTGLPINVPIATGGRVGEVDFAVPYHTTATKMLDICTMAGLTSTGLKRATLTQLNPGGGGVAAVFENASCGNLTPNPNLRLGEFVRLKDPVAAHTFIPAHF